MNIYIYYICIPTFPISSVLDKSPTAIILGIWGPIGTWGAVPLIMCIYIYICTMIGAPYRNLWMLSPKVGTSILEPGGSTECQCRCQCRCKPPTLQPKSAPKAEVPSTDPSTR